MEYRRPYGADALFELPLVTAGDGEFLAAFPAEFVAADVLASYRSSTGAVQVAPASLSAVIVGFDSMDALPSQGDVIAEQGGDWTGTVMFVIIASGTVGAGTAAGFMFVKGVSGTNTDNSTLNNSTTSDTDFCTVDAGVQLWTTSAATAAGTPGWANGRAYVALTAAEMSTACGSIWIKDATATELWEDTAITFLTEGHESAFDPQGCILTQVLTNASTSVLLRLTSAPTTAPLQDMYFEVRSTGTGDPVIERGHIKSYMAGATYDIVPYVALTAAPDSGSAVIRVYVAARSPAQVVANEGTITTLDALDTAQDTQHSTTQGRLPTALGADGFIKASIWGAMGTALTETAGQIAAAFTKFFDKATPTGTVNSLPDAVAGAASGLAIVGSETDLIAATKARLLASGSVTRIDAREALSAQLTVAADAGNSATTFKVGTDASTDVRTGFLKLTSGAIAGESQLVKWTGTQVTVLSDSSMPVGLKGYSAAPAAGVTGEFTPL